jgi:hypothetical protein
MVLHRPFEPAAETGEVDFQVSGNAGAFDRSMQRHLGSDLFKGGVYDPTEAIETFTRGKAGHLAPMEVRAVDARNRTRLWQATSHNS